MEKAESITRVLLNAYLSLTFTQDLVLLEYYFYFYFYFFFIVYSDISFYVISR